MLNIRKSITGILLATTLVFIPCTPSVIHAEETEQAEIICARAKSSVASGQIDYSAQISLYTVTKGAKIYYTIDGSMPSKEKTEYKGTLSYKDIFGEAEYSEYDAGEEITAELKTVSVIDINGKDIYSDVSVYKYTLKEENISAYDINVPGLFRETIENNGDCDYYSFELKEKTIIDITLEYPEESICAAALCDKDRNIIETAEYGYVQSIRKELDQGRYYIKVYGVDGCERGVEYTLRAGSNRPDNDYADNEENIVPPIQDVIYVPDNNIHTYREALKNYIYAYGSAIVPCREKTYIITGWDEENYICGNNEKVNCETIENEHMANGTFVVRTNYNLNDYEGFHGELTGTRKEETTVSGLSGISSVYKTGAFWEVIDCVSFDCSKSGINYSIDIVTDNHTYRIAEGITAHSGINNIMCNATAYVEPEKEFEVIVWFCSFEKYRIPFRQASKNHSEIGSYVIKAGAKDNLLESGLCAPVSVYSRVDGAKCEDDYSRLFTGANTYMQNDISSVKSFFKSLPEKYDGNELYGFGGYTAKMSEAYENNHKEKVTKYIAERCQDKDIKKVEEYASIVYKSAWLNIKKNNYQLFNRADSIQTDQQKLEVSVTSTSGTDVYLTATLGENVDDDYIVWKVSGDSSVYTLKNDVSKSGERVNVCRVRKKGSLTITAYARSNPGLISTVSVSVKKINTNNLKDTSIKVVKSVKLNKKSIVLKRGKQTKLKVSVTPSNAMNSAISWQSSNRKICVVNSKGVVTAKRGGKCYITALNEFSEKSATCKVVVGYKIRYRCRGGKNNVNNPHSYMKGDKIILKNPKRAGYIFKGWYTGRSMKPNNRVRVIRKTSHKDYTLYAKWEKKR